MSDTIRVLVSGSGKMGRAIAEALEAADGVEPVGILEKFADASTFVLSSGTSLPMTPDADAAMSDLKPNVVIDFTNVAWTPVAAEAAVRHGVRPVIGTSGLSEAFVRDLAEKCAEHKLGGVVAANFAIGAVLMMHFARIAARFFDSAEVIELHHDQKVDAPSGTAIATAQGMAQARGKSFARNEPEVQTVPGSRTASVEGVTVHSVRLPGLVAHQEVLFGGLGQWLSIRHDTTGREAFMPGILLAAREVMNRSELVVGLDALVGLT